MLLRYFFPLVYKHFMMGDRREDYTNLSLMLSLVMDDVGVNEESVLRRRRTNLVIENIDTYDVRTRQLNQTQYIFGSQTEGTTTDGLNSDLDILSVMDDFIVIQHLKDWEPGKVNLLMIRDERRFPGYCKVQMLCDDAPLPLRRVVPPGDLKFVNDGDGKVMLKGFPIQSFSGYVRHGPAVTRSEGDIEHDFVPALKCCTWPKHYKQWTPNERRRDWPTPEMIHYMKSTGCFIVMATHPHDDTDETWRISTSLAERCLMFSLNITQIRCNVLLKMIVQTFISPYLPETISSYMCKTLLFHCIENTPKEFWKEHNLLQCVHQVLLYMIAAVLDENCPNFFYKSANIFLGKIDNGNKLGLLQRLRSLMQNKSRFLLEINFDQISFKLTRHITGTNLRAIQDDIANNRIVHTRKLMNLFFSSLSIVVVKLMRSHQSHKDDLLTVSRDFINQGYIQSKALCLILPFVCSYMACIEASKCILQGTDPTPACLKLFDLSLNSDVTSSRLKFASYLYCTGQLERTLSVLQDVEERMDDSVMMKCGCHEFIDPKWPRRFGKRETSQQYQTTDSVALCVMFSMAESQCCPRELKYELFRSTDQEIRKRDEHYDYWMDLVVMDALPYLYYLQYMTYRHLGQNDLQYMALNKLSDCARNNEYLIHEETACNVLGQCMEYEGWLDDAFECYRASLIFRPNNNAVRWHIIRLMARLARQRGHQL